MLYRVTASRVMTGYAKASVIYEAGEILDPAHMIEGHFERLQAVGALEPVEPPAPPPAAKAKAPK